MGIFFDTGQLDTSPDTYIALSVLVIPHSLHCAVRLKANGMTTTRRYGIFRPSFTFNTASFGEL
ncbi:hypothetical protein GCM10023310_31700 [Paenibacillus vulneris]